VTLPEIALFGGTRLALGIGVGLLIAGKFSRDQRKGAGWALLTAGALTTIPFAVAVAGRKSASNRSLALAS